MSLVFAASYPERVSALVLYGGVARALWAPDYQFAERPWQRDRRFSVAFEESAGGPEPYIRTGLSRGDAAEVRAP